MSRLVSLEVSSVLQERLAPYAVMSSTSRATSGGDDAVRPSGRDAPTQVTRARIAVPAGIVRDDRAELTGSEDACAFTGGVTPGL